jgi:hypothetical protein
MDTSSFAVAVVGIPTSIDITGGSYNATSDIGTQGQFDTPFSATVNPEGSYSAVN